MQNELAKQGPEATTTWPQDMAFGLTLLLSSRTGQQQRHAALQLAAHMVDLAGPEWLLQRGAQVC